MALYTGMVNQLVLQEVANGNLWGPVLNARSWLHLRPWTCRTLCWLSSVECLTLDMTYNHKSAAINKQGRNKLCALQSWGQQTTVHGSSTHDSSLHHGVSSKPTETNTGAEDHRQWTFLPSQHPAHKHWKWAQASPELEDSWCMDASSQEFYCCLCCLGY